MTGTPTLVEPKYYFRVDAQADLRQLRDVDVFSPARWDHGEHRFPHRSLQQALQTLPTDAGIYRLSFWENEALARLDLSRRGSREPHAMMRVSRSDVRRWLDGWHVEADDGMGPGEAALIWSVQPSNEGAFWQAGVPLSCFEVWNGAAWGPWPACKLIEPDALRMSRIGWRPLSLSTRQARGTVQAYWTAVSDGAEPGCGRLRILLTLDDRSTGSLGGEDMAVSEAAAQLIEGELALVASNVASIVTVYVDTFRLWTEQFEVRPASKWARWLTGGRKARATATRKVPPDSWLDDQALRRLIHASGLPLARPEMRTAVWDVTRP